MTSWEVRRLAERLGMPEPSTAAVALARAAVVAERSRAHRIALQYAETNPIANTIALRIAEKR